MNATDTNDIRVVVAHPDPILTMGLVAALRTQIGIQVFLPESGEGGAAAHVVISNFERGLQIATGRGPVPGGSAGPRVLVVAPQVWEHEVRLAMETGVHGFVVQDCRIEELVDAVRMLAQGRRYMCLSVAQCVAESLVRESLTTRETQVLQLLAGGHCNKVIARQLDIAPGTVKGHLMGIMSKLDVSTRTQAVSVAVARGLVQALPPRVQDLRRRLGRPADTSARADMVGPGGQA